MKLKTQLRIFIIIFIVKFGINLIFWCIFLQKSIWNWGEFHLVLIRRIGYTPVVRPLYGQKRTEEIKMKKAILVCFSSSIFLLGGYKTDLTESKISQENISLKQQENKSQVIMRNSKELNAQEYEEQTSIIFGKDMDKIVTDLLHSLTSEDASIKENNTNLQKFLIDFRSIKNKLQELQPPNEYKIEHERFIKVMNLYEDAFILEVESIKENNTEKLKLALEKIEIATQYINDSEIYPVK